MFQPQDRPKAKISGTYDIERFHHILHGHGVNSLYSLSDTPDVLTHVEMVVCHALLTKMRLMLEMDWKEKCNPNKQAWDIETDRHRMYKDHRFQEYYNKSKPLFIYDDRIPRRQTTC